MRKGKGAGRAGAISHDEAQTIAIEALAALARDPDALADFAALTGIGLETLRQAAAAPDFLRQVLAHVCADEARLLACADAIGRPPHAIAAAAERLAVADRRAWGVGHAEA